MFYILVFALKVKISQVGYQAIITWGVRTQYYVFKQTSVLCEVKFNMSGQSYNNDSNLWIDIMGKYALGILFKTLAVLGTLKKIILVIISTQYQFTGKYH